MIFQNFSFVYKVQELCMCVLKEACNQRFWSAILSMRFLQRIFLLQNFLSPKVFEAAQNKPESFQATKLRSTPISKVLTHISVLKQFLPLLDILLYLMTLSYQIKVVFSHKFLCWYETFEWISSTSQNLTLRYQNWKGTNYCDNVFITTSRNVSLSCLLSWMWCLSID